MGGRASRLLVPATIIGLILLFFNRLAFSNLILARGDTFLYFYPYWQAAATALRDGHLPLWNPNIFMGAPFLANSQAGLLYPLNWPVWALWPTPYAVSVSILVHVSIAGWGAYLAGRRTLALQPWAALFGAVLFALGGYLTAQVEHVNQLQGLAWLPWYFFALAPLVSDSNETFGRRSGLIAAVGFGLLAALQLLAGHTQTVFISGVAATVWLLPQVIGHRQPAGQGWRLLLMLAAGVILAALLAASQLLPTLELTGASSRQGGLALNEVLSFSWHPLHLSRALLPPYNRPIFSEYTAFLPITGLVLALVGAWSWRRNRSIFPWVVLVAVSFILALGRFTPFYYLLGNLPGFDLFRVPARWLAPAALGLALLAGAGWQRLWNFSANHWESEQDRQAEGRALRRSVMAALATIVVLLLWSYAAGWLARIVPAGSEAPFEYPVPFTLLGWLIELALLALLLWIILSGQTGRGRPAAFDLLILALVVMWLGSRNSPYNRLTTPQAYFDLRSPPAWLQVPATCILPDQACAPPPDRFLSLSDIFFDLGDQAEIDSIYADQLDEAARYDYTIAAKHKEVISPNLSMIFALPAVDGFDGGILPLRNYAELIRLLLPTAAATTDGRLREYLESVPEGRWLNLFNSRYVITDKVGDVWREGVYFDKQFPVQVGREPVGVGAVPAYEATELWLLSDDTVPSIAVRTSTGQQWLLLPEPLTDPDLYRVTFPEPAIAEQIVLQPCPTGDVTCTVDALTLVDYRDETFLSLVPGPYRLTFSGDVKIYENLNVLPRAFLVYDWHWQPDVTSSVAFMQAAGFDPTTAAVVVGEGQSPGTAGNGTATISRYTADHVIIQVESDQAGLLLLTDAYYPGWQAAIDGESAPIYPADALFRAVFVPAGSHEVEFVFRPGSFRVGVVVSLGGIALLIGLGLWLWRTRPAAVGLK